MVALAVGAAVRVAVEALAANYPAEISNLATGKLPKRGETRSESTFLFPPGRRKVVREGYYPLRGSFVGMT